MSALSVGRIVVVALAALFTLASMVLMMVGIATPSWQTVYLTDLGQEHYHGLWVRAIIPSVC